MNTAGRPCTILDSAGNWARIQPRCGSRRDDSKLIIRSRFRSRARILGIQLLAELHAELIGGSAECRFAQRLVRISADDGKRPGKGKCPIVQPWITEGVIRAILPEDIILPAEFCCQHPAGLNVHYRRIHSREKLSLDEGPWLNFLRRL